MFLINDMYLTHTDISCSHHHNCSFSKPFLNKCREICLQLPNTTASSEISWVFLKFSGSMKIVKWFPSVSTKLSSTQRITASTADTEHNSGNYLLTVAPRPLKTYVSSTQAKLWTVSLMLKPGSQELLLRYSRETEVLHYAVSIFLGAVHSSEVALAFAKAKSCLQLGCFCSEWHWAGNYTVWISKIFTFQVRWMTPLEVGFKKKFYKEMGVLPTNI